MAFRYFLLFAIVWHIIPIRWLYFLLEGTPLTLILSIFTPPDSCAFSLSSELLCCVLYEHFRHRHFFLKFHSGLWSCLYPGKWRVMSLKWF
jgi:hypothetical protein